MSEFKSCPWCLAYSHNEFQTWGDIQPMTGPGNHSLYQNDAWKEQQLIREGHFQANPAMTSSAGYRYNPL